MRLKLGATLWVERNGVQYAVSPAMLRADKITDEVFRMYGVEAVVTSGCEVFDADGEIVHHTRLSEHWQGNALDYRIKHLPGVSIHQRQDGSWYHRDRDQILPGLVADLRARLGPDYDVILEGNHIHIQNRPEKLYWV